jgi:hypothetical protein
VGGVEPRNVARIEDSGEGLYRLQLVLHGAQVFLLQHPSDGGGLVGVIREGVPAAEAQVLQTVQRHEILDPGRAVLGPFPEPDRSQPSQRTHRFGEALLYELHPCDEGGSHRPIPCVRTPSLPCGAWISLASDISLTLSFRCLARRLSSV